MSESDTPSVNSTQLIHPEFESAFQQVKECFFSRNPEYWPCFNEPGFKQVIDFRKKQILPDERLAAYSGGAELHQSLLNETKIPTKLTVPTGQTDDILQFAAALSKDWENPASVENVITMPSDPGIYGAMMGSLANPKFENVQREILVLARGECERCE